MILGVKSLLLRAVAATTPKTSRARNWPPGAFALNIARSTMSVKRPITNLASGECQLTSTSRTWSRVLVRHLLWLPRRCWSVVFRRLTGSTAARWGLSDL